MGEANGRAKAGPFFGGFGGVTTNMLLRIINGEQLDAAHIELTASLIQRASTAPLPTRNKKGSKGR